MASVCTVVMFTPAAACGAAAAGAASLPGPALPVLLPVVLLAMVLLVAEGISVKEGGRAGERERQESGESGGRVTGGARTAGTRGSAHATARARAAPAPARAPLRGPPPQSHPSLPRRARGGGGHVTARGGRLAPNGHFPLTLPFPPRPARGVRRGRAALLTLCATEPVGDTLRSLSLGRNGRLSHAPAPPPALLLLPREGERERREGGREREAAAARTPARRGEAARERAGSWPARGFPRRTPEPAAAAAALPARGRRGAAGPSGGRRAARGRHNGGAALRGSRVSLRGFRAARSRH